MENTKINYELNKHLTDAICAAGANLQHLQHLLTKKYVSKIEMRKTLAIQSNLLSQIEESKNRILTLNK